MTEAAIKLALSLAQSSTAVQAVSLLVAAPVLAPGDLIEVVRHPETYGIPSAESQRLHRAGDWLATALRALTGELDASVPAELYGQLAMTSRLQGKREQAKRFYQYSFENAKSAADKAAALSGTAILEMYDNADRARTIFRQAQAICEHGQVAGRTLAHILSNLGGLEMNAEHWTDAVVLFEKARTIGLLEQLPDVYALARMNQAEMAARQGKAAEASHCLDDIRWIEGSGSPQEQDYLAMRRRVAQAQSEEQPDPESQTIDELEQRLLNFGMRVSAGDDLECARVQKALGSRYFERLEGPRVENVTAAVNHWESALAFLEKGKVAGKLVREIGNQSTMMAVLAGLHGDLGRAYNEWYSLDHASGSAPKAREHFQAALQALPEGAEFEEYRRGLLNNLANAEAWNAKTSMSWVTGGQPDRTTLRNSLLAQAQLLQKMGNDPVARCQLLINLCQTYRELSEADPDGARGAYFPAAWDCISAADEALEKMNDPQGELVLGIMAMKAQTAAEMGRSAGELADLRKRLDALLRHENLNAIRPAIWGMGFRASARLARLADDHARSYRRLLVAMRLLRLRSASQPVALDTAAADLQRTNSELVQTLTDSGQLDRAIFFAGTPPSERVRQYPRGKRWAATADSCAVLFHLMSTTRFCAFVITPGGVKVRELPLEPLDLIRSGGRFLSAKVASEEGTATPASSADWLSAMDWVSHWIGEKLFAPLEDLLPQGGPLVLVPESPMMRTLPLHLAVLTGGRFLLDRFIVTFCSQLSFEDGKRARDERPQAGEVFIAGYSPNSARLPFAALEVRATAENYSTGARIESGDSATPDKVLKGLESSRLVHLCCHGNFDWASPLNSELIFSGRVLTVREVQLSLARSLCGLIVLSACEAGARGSGTDGPSDFASILLHAGCGIVIAADWRIDDLSTTVLMSLLHEELAKGAGAPEALAAAQRKIQNERGGAMAERAAGWLKQCAAELAPAEQAYVRKKLDALAERKDDPVFAHPVYWGSFSANAARFQLARYVHTENAGKATSNEA